MNEVNYQQMTPSQLKQYLSINRNDESKFSAALGELISRDIWTEVDADTPISEQEAIVQKLIEKKKSS
ncbi:MAG: DUF6887 family protein [Chroococcidiopsis sp.]